MSPFHHYINCVLHLSCSYTYITFTQKPLSAISSRFYRRAIVLCINMDRLRKDVDNVNSSTQPVVESARKKSVIVYDPTDIVNYMGELRDTYLNQREKYDGFLALMKEHNDKRVDNPDFIAGLKELFLGHHNLVLGFNKFLSRGNAITLYEKETAPDKRKTEFEEALFFVEKVKKIFKSNTHVYNCFLDHLDAYKHGAKSIHEAYREGLNCKF
ncbi:OLC1v1004970C3 [Oldenlandia corymbosa var. corymbosa]|uniref:OLC1v1004970C3 n=1 Tax=Oldenlandia corymbosa var. corymbosa TaxID=529605 RepID=A0AAV1DET9_OLDCO|nr:OLC1v1004970C3 [Oldenlandia corymbosa var. corymbosa]